ncbi:hypothetical protein [Macrococcus sp. DPC7161]|uniref:hypothetical protein n=1 Tax=Macrococcus sp. DPC7161 TaxID=2507060 RepID=UPI00100AF7E0|nr:hypothetical protein [Macrococcus sp. DPC7161]RXK17593.1 hypothetical protein ER639_09685 [Macrococcus sp. DPC7161]
MFNEKERIHLIVCYGAEDAIDIYHQHKPSIDMSEFSLFKSKFKLPSHRFSQNLAEAITYFEYCYQLHKDNYDEVLDFFNTLRAIERQVAN